MQTQTYICCNMLGIFLYYIHETAIQEYINMWPQPCAFFVLCKSKILIRICNSLICPTFSLRSTVLQLDIMNWLGQHISAYIYIHHYVDFSTLLLYPNKNVYFVTPFNLFNGMDGRMFLCSWCIVCKKAKCNFLKKKNL